MTMSKDNPAEVPDAPEATGRPQDGTAAPSTDTSAAATSATPAPAAPAAGEPTAAPSPAAAPAPAAVPVGYGAASGYGTATPDIEDDVEIEAVAATLTGPSLAARLGAELFGSFVVLLAVIGAGLFAQFTGQTLAVALAYGFGVIAAFVAVAHVSGGHFNPAVTLGSAVAGRTPWSHVLPYWVAQVVGGALAAAVLFVVASSFPLLDSREREFFGGAANGFDAHSPLALQTSSTEGFSVVAALLIEAVLVAVLVGVYLAATGRRSSRGQAGVAIGLTVGFATLVALPVTNAALNPARATAAAIFAESWAWGQVWVFWVGPLVGALVAGVLYRAFATAPEDDELLDEELEIEAVEVEPLR